MVSSGLYAGKPNIVFTARKYHKVMSLVVKYNVVRVTNGTQKVLERCDDEQHASDRRRTLCTLFGVDSTEIRIAKEFQDTETILREVIRFGSPLD